MLTFRNNIVDSKKLIVTMVVQNSREELKAAYHKKQKKMKARVLARVFRNQRPRQHRANNANAGQQANANANAAVVAAAAAVLVPDVVEEPENAVDD